MNTASRAESNKKQEIIFKDKEHKKFYVDFTYFSYKKDSGSDRFPFTMNVKGGGFLTFEEIKNNEEKILHYFLFI